MPCITLLLAIFSQDIRTRMVSIYLYIFLFLIFITRNIFSQELWEWLAHALINLIFVFSQVSVIYTYCRFIKKGKFSDCIGDGDILFWIIISFAFHPINFIIFFLTGLVLALIWGTISALWAKTVPLAGIQASFLAFVLGTDWLLQSNDLLRDSQFLVIFLTEF